MSYQNPDREPPIRVFYVRGEGGRFDEYLEVGGAWPGVDGELLVHIDRQPVGGFCDVSELVFELRPKLDKQDAA